MCVCVSVMQIYSNRDYKSAINYSDCDVENVITIKDFEIFITEIVIISHQIFCNCYYQVSLFKNIPASRLF